MTPIPDGGLPLRYKRHPHRALPNTIIPPPHTGLHPHHEPTQDTRPHHQSPSPRQRSQQGIPPPHHRHLGGYLPTGTPDVHRRNIAKRAIRTFKAHFLSILAGIPSSLPNYLWDKLLLQTELSLNLLRQSTIAPLLSAWEAFNGPFNFDTTPSAP